MTAGDIVLVHFPFSDLSGSKLRPAVVLADVGRKDFVACQITSNRDSDAGAIELTPASFALGALKVISYARPGKLFTAHQSIVAKRVAQLTDVVKEQVRTAVIDLIRRG